MSPSTPQLGSYPASFSLSNMDTRRLPFNKFLRRSNQHLWTVYQQHSRQVNSKLCFLASDQRTCNASMSHSHCSKPMLIQLCADIGLCHDLSTTENKLLSPVLCHVTLHTYAILMSQELSDLHFFPSSPAPLSPYFWCLSSGLCLAMHSSSASRFLLFMTQVWFGQSFRFAAFVTRAWVGYGTSASRLEWPFSYVVYRISNKPFN